jgi:hypothetical protein
MPKPLTKRERSIAAKYRRMQKAQERAGAQYELADRLAFKIAAQTGGKLVRISDTLGILAVDQAKAALEHPKRKPDQMPKIWAHAAARLIAIEEVKLTVE